MTMDNPKEHSSKKCFMENFMGKIKGSKMKARRCKANARERNRMHGLNAALDRLRR